MKMPQVAVKPVEQCSKGSRRKSGCFCHTQKGFQYSEKKAFEVSNFAENTGAEVLIILAVKELLAAPLYI
jgi:hypothetical protein